MAGAWKQLAQVFESPCLPPCNDAMLTAVHDNGGIYFPTSVSPLRLLLCKSIIVWINKCGFIRSFTFRPYLPHWFRRRLAAGCSLRCSCPSAGCRPQAHLRSCCPRGIAGRRAAPGAASCPRSCVCEFQASAMHAAGCFPLNDLAGGAVSIRTNSSC